MSRPLRCRLSIHQPETVKDGCRQLEQCSRCGDHLDEVFFHSWEEPQTYSDDRDPCAAMETCTACGKERQISVHTFRIYAGDKVPTPRVQLESFERHQCVRVEICERCNWTGSDSWDHDYRGGRKCHRCGDIYQESEA